MNIKHYTRFRAYQLSECGASFSLSVDNHFTLIEARYNDSNKPHIQWEMKQAGVSMINTLHITSWDEDHCKEDELQCILRELRPLKIEYPSYTPHTENGKKCLDLIKNYQNCPKSIFRCDLFPVTFQTVKDQVKIRLRGEDLFYNPEQTIDKPNDNSVVKFFRIGSFQILSLGDCESGEIRNRLMDDVILRTEVDVLILAHHGADNDFTTADFLKALSPKVAICAADYGNKYGHPDKAVTDRLRSANIDYYSTKTGDVIAQSVDKFYFKVSNYISNNEKNESEKIYTNKTYYIND